MVTTAIDGPLAVSRRRLADAVAALADPVAVSVGGGAYRWADPLYAQLRGALSGGSPTMWRSRTHRARPPCRVDVLNLLIEVDRTVGGWEPHGKTTLDRLHELAGRGWRPQDCDLIDGYTDHLARWCVAGAELLGASARVYLPTPCPQCGALFAYRRDGAGERVRARALRVSETGCKCGAVWGPELFDWLARLMGCAGLPA